MQGAGIQEGQQEQWLSVSAHQCWNTVRQCTQLPLAGHLWLHTKLMYIKSSSR